MLRKVILYNPRAVFWTMPLALVAVGSALDRSRYTVALVDGRLEADPLEAILRHLDKDAVCVAMTVLSGAPIRDALAVSRALKGIRPSVPIVWGGWHPSLFPEQCLAESCVDAVVVGQGELTFAEVVECLADNRSLEGVAGCAYRRRDEPPRISPPRAFCDVNLLPAHDYGLAAVERYFECKRRRQFDYVSSQGCRFRCAFCADPAVFKRGWYGLAPERMAAELGAHHRKYRYEEISFQDETFFTSPARVGAIAEALLRNGLNVDWTATMRSDQGSRLDDRLMALCKRSGLKRVMIGVESGSQDTLRRIQKDITLSQVFDSATRCERHGVGAILNFIVGFPGEPDDSIQQTLDAAARLRAMSRDFELSIFYFRPYPGNPISESLVRDGYIFPSTLEEWADFDYVESRGKWVTGEQWKRIERFKFYQRFAFGQDRRNLGRPLQLVSRWRIRRRCFSFPLEKVILENLRPAQKLT
jgi:anaerobic magnesium-protoporphyrin IX monomethyl ester cyclase